MSNHFPTLGYFPTPIMSLRDMTFVKAAEHTDMSILPPLLIRICLNRLRIPNIDLEELNTASSLQKIAYKVKMARLGKDPKLMLDKCPFTFGGLVLPFKIKDFNENPHIVFLPSVVAAGKLRNPAYRNWVTAAIYAEIRLTKNPTLIAAATGIITEGYRETKSFHYPFKIGLNPLEVSILMNQTEHARYLIDNCPSSYIISRQWRFPPESLAISMKNIPLFRYIYQKNTEQIPLLCRVLKTNQITPLHVAAKRGEVALMHTLITEYKQDVNAISEYFGTVLECAKKSKNAQAVKLLLDNGAKPKDKKGSGTFGFGTTYGNSEVRNKYQRLS